MKLIIHNKPHKRLIHVLAMATLLPFIFIASGCSLLKKQEVDTEPLSAEVLYGAAKEALLEEHWGDAVEKLKTLEARYPYGGFAKQAQLETAYAEYKLGNDGLAIVAADRFILLNPTHSAVDYAYYIKGLASFKEVPGIKGLLTGRSNLAERDPQAVNDALLAFNTVVQRYPDSTYAHDARRRISYLQSAKAEYEVSVARFYYNRAAYIASVNRSKSILERYAQLPEAEHALGIIFLSYQQMKMTNLAEDAKRVLKLNYPNSAYLQRRLTSEPKKGRLGQLFRRSEQKL